MAGVGVNCRGQPCCSSFSEPGRGLTRPPHYAHDDEPPPRLRPTADHILKVLLLRQLLLVLVLVLLLLLTLTSADHTLKVAAACEQTTAEGISRMAAALRVCASDCDTKNRDEMTELQVKNIYASLL